MMLGGVGVLIAAWIAAKIRQAHRTTSNFLVLWILGSIILLFSYDSVNRRLDPTSLYMWLIFAIISAIVWVIVRAVRGRSQSEEE